MTTNQDLPLDRTREVLGTAHDALIAAARGVPAGAWTAATPCAEWTVLQVLQHAAGDQQAYVRELTGRGGPTQDPFSPSGAVDGDPVSLVQQAVDAARAAWAAEKRATVPTPLPQGGLTLPVAMGAAALDALVHAWDVCVATGQASPLTDDDAAVLQVVADQLVEPLRQWGVYAAPVVAGPGAADRLLGHLGRDPHWTR